MAFWLNWDASANNDRLAMEFTPNFNNSTTGFMINPNSSAVPGRFEAGVRGDAGYNQVNFSRPGGGWHRYAFVFNKGAPAANQVTPYVDGVAVPYAKHASAENTNRFGSDILFLASRSGQSLFGAGAFDDLYVYNRALTASEISGIYFSAAYAYWKLDFAILGGTPDSAGGRHSVALANSPALQSGASCVMGSCFRFNGTNQYAFVSSANPLDLSDTKVITVAFWLNRDAYANDDRLAMEFTPNFNNATTGFFIDPNSSTVPGKFEAGVKGDGGYNQVNFTRPSTGGWHHYAFVFDKGAPAASEVVPYVDGVAVAYAKHASSENSNNFGSDTLFFTTRNGTSLFGAGVQARPDCIGGCTTLLAAVRLLNNNLYNCGAGFILRPVSTGLLLRSSPSQERR